MDVLYSDEDIQNKLHGRCLILKYGSLARYPNIETLLADGDGCVAILVETVDSLGHWICIVEGTGRQEGKTFFFDSYGKIIDSQLAHIDPKWRIKSGQDFTWLATLLAAGVNEIDWNPHQLQSESESVATCGRWVVARCTFSWLSADEFAEMFTKWDASPDEIVVALTDRL